MLGPLLCIIYANNIPKQLKHSRTQMYADDIQLYLDSSLASIDNGVKDLNTDLNNIYLWATANYLRINPKKSNVL